MKKNLKDIKSCRIHPHYFSLKLFMNRELLLSRFSFMCYFPRLKCCIFILQMRLLFMVFLLLFITFNAVNLCSILNYV